ncbi:radical SAM/SPASM domain-containing protein [Prosthecochloris aestuarii]|nr:radical SAM protein [Prosthecochloris aestuarii]
MKSKKFSKKIYDYSAYKYLQKHPGYVAAKCSKGGRAEVFCLETGERTEIEPPAANMYLKRESISRQESFLLTRDGYNSKHFFNVPQISTSHLFNRNTYNEVCKHRAIKGKNIKIVPVSGDVVLLHNTSSLHQIISSDCQMKDNPMVALGRLYAQAYHFLIQGESYIDTYKKLKRMFGDFVNEDTYMAFICDLEKMGFLKRNLLSRLDQGSLAGLMIMKREWDLDISRIQKYFTYTELPLYTLLELNYECNLTCEVCYTKNLSKNVNALSDELFLSEVLQPIIDSGVSYVTILGGEPLLKKDLLYEVVCRLRKNNIYVKIITNGTLIISKDHAFELVEAGVNKIEISFDGLSVNKDNAIRVIKKGFLNMNVHLVAKKAIAYLKQAGIPQVGVSVTVNTFNYDEILNEMIPFVRETKVNKIYISIYYSDKFDESHLEIDTDQKKVLLDRCSEWNNTLSSEVYDFEAVILGSDTSWRCTCGRSSVVVNPFGVMRACPFSSNNGDCLDSSYPGSFKDIWSNSDLFWTIRRLPKNECSTRLFRDTGVYLKD